MKTAKSKQSMMRNLIKFSNYSVCVTLPKNALEELGWHSGDQVYIKSDFNNKALIISKTVPKNPEMPPAEANPSKLRW